MNKSTNNNIKYIQMSIDTKQLSKEHTSISQLMYYSYREN